MRFPICAFANHIEDKDPNLLSWLISVQPHFHKLSMPMSLGQRTREAILKEASVLKDTKTTNRAFSHIKC